MTHSFPTRRSSDLLKPEQVKIHTLYAGGSFGRRANTVSDYVVEGAEIAKAYGKAPVRLVWTREDDVRGGRYRPMYHHALKAAVDAEGNIIAWQHRIVGQSIIGGTPFEPVMVKNGIDGPSSAERRVGKECGSKLNNWGSAQ